MSGDGGEGLPPLPAGFVARMRELRGDEGGALAEALDGPPVAGLRLNPLRGEPEALRRRLPWRMTPVPWCPEGYVLEALRERPRPGVSALHAAGTYYLQDPSAMAPAAALAPSPGERVCDLAAAPGGKSTQLAARMRGDGVLVANDADATRARALVSNLERWGAANALVTQEAPERLARVLAGWFDRVLLDAPCSGEGMFRKSAEARRQWSPELVAGCSATQASLLDAAGRLVRPGGLLAYSTCTFEPDENEGLIAGFLRRRPDFAAEPVTLSGLEPAVGGAGAVVWPHRQRGDGQFVALLRRLEPRAGVPTREPEPSAGAAGSGASPGYARALPAPARVQRAWQSFAEAVLGEVPFPDARLLLHGDRLLAAPPDLPPAERIHLLRVGVLLGRWRPSGERFEPAHALALAARPGGRTLSFPDGDPRLAAYLRGEPFAAAGVKGWLRVAVDGLAVGWGRAGAGSVRSLLPHGLRRNG